MVKEAVILAGGLGTRLRSAVPDLPKCMAPVAGKPFLSFVIDYLRMQGIEKIIFSLGFRAELIQEWLGEQYPTLDYTTVVETEPLGTGGGMALALQQARDPQVLVVNGDTLFRVKLAELFSFHIAHASECTLALKPLQHFDRYGVVETGADGKILSFREKQFYEQGLINGGVYLVDRGIFLKRPLERKFSFEKDYLEKYSAEGRFYGCAQNGYFIDIGIPEDYEQAGRDLKKPELDLKLTDKNWTLFLDRDGVINDEKLGEYVLHWDQFIFSKGVLGMFKKLSDHFGRIIIVSNQRGVGKGLMTEATLQSIHLEMQREVAIVNGRIDRVYYCTEKEETNFNRKPNPGMALQALREFPEIDPDRSIMVGNKPSDMRFGRYAGFFTVFVTTTNPDQPFPHPDIDQVFPSLYDFAGAVG